MKSTSKRLSLTEIKAKAGEALLDAEAIRGGTADSCHVDDSARTYACDLFDVPQEHIHKTDNA